MLLRVFIDQLAPVVDQFFVNSYLPEETKKYLSDHNVEVFHTRKQRLKFLTYLAKCDVVLFAGGSILKELYTAYGADSYATLNTIKSLTDVSHGIFRKPIYFTHIGVGPLKSPKGEKLSEKILNNVASLSVRDRASSEIVARLNTKLEPLVVPDAAFSIDRSYLGIDEARQKTLNKKKTLKIGLNLCRNIANDGNWGHFMDKLLDDFTTLSNETKDLEIIGLAMQFDTPNNDDYRALVEFKAALKKRVPNLQFAIIKPGSIRDVATTVDSVDILVAERLHALILSSILGVPFVALEYDPKVTSVVSDLGLSEYGININEPIPPGAILKIIKNITTHYHDVASKITAASSRQQAEARRAFETLKQSLLRSNKTQEENLNV